VRERDPSAFIGNSAIPQLLSVSSGLQGEPYLIFSPNSKFMFGAELPLKLKRILKIESAAGGPDDG